MARNKTFMVPILTNLASNDGAYLLGARKFSQRFSDNEERFRKILIENEFETRILCFEIRTSFSETLQLVFLNFECYMQGMQL